MSQELFDLLSDGICVSDPTGKILYANPAAARFFGVSHARVKGKRLCEVLCGHLAQGGAPECASTCELLKPGSNADTVTFRGNFGPQETASWKDFAVHRRYTWKPLRVRCLKPPPSFGGEGRHLTLIEDASADVEIERQREDWRQMIAHDLRSPLSNIYATICVAQEAAGGPMPAGSRELIEAAARSCKKMLELITLYLDVAKLDAGVEEVKPAPLFLAKAVREEVAEQEPAMRGKQQEVAVAVPEEILVEADADLLSRVVQNVLDNAVKFTPAGGRIELSARVQGSEAELSIKDSGLGIPAEELPLLFDRYHQARARRAGRLQGTGLGLTFCKEALKIMRGGIDVESKPNEGTKFFIRLPLAATTPKADGSPPPDERAP
ncbi:MAG: ATP-binding protein [Elusimicrobiota bacterium]